MDLNAIVRQANTYQQRAAAELRPMLTTAAEWLVNLRLFLQYLMERFRKIDIKELQLYKLAIFGFGFVAGLCAPRRFRKFKAVILIASIVSAAVFVYRLLTVDRD